MSDPSTSAVQASDFARRIDAILGAIEAAVDDLADDIDIDSDRSGNVLTLTFDNGHRMVVNSQESMHEVWVAARSGGFHFRWDEAAARWSDTRSGEDLVAALTRLITAESGRTPTIVL